MFGAIRTIVNVVLGVIELLLSLRFMLKFFSVKTSVSFAAWIYGATVPLVGPFIGIFSDLKIGGFVVDFSILIALAVYIFIGYSMLQIFSYADSRHYRDNDCL